MAERKIAYLGYDLGDGETVTDMTVVTEQTVHAATRTNWNNMTMPDSNDPGKAIPTAFAFDSTGKVVFAESILSDAESYKNICVNFKRRPSDMIAKTDSERTKKIIDAFEQGWPTQTEVPEANFQELNEFAKAVVNFTNAIFNNEQYIQRLNSSIADCDSIVFVVGHPTKWDVLDVAIYKAILSKSVLGSGTYDNKPCEIIMDAESRAAFLFVKDCGVMQVLFKDKATILIDVGSSTIDVTALTSDSRDRLFNNGNNYLGARCIDFLIRNWYLKKLQSDANDWNDYQDLIRHNPSLKKALTLACREAKENVFSLSSGVARINFANFASMRITKADIDTLVNTMPIVDVLQAEVDLPEEVAQKFGKKTWMQLFYDFVTEQKTALEQKGISIGRIILTGSASKMPYVKTIIADIFKNELKNTDILFDMDASHSIAKGLALSGAYDETARQFQAEVNKFVQDDLSDCIKRNIGSLAEGIGTVVEKKLTPIILQRMSQWKNGTYATLNDMSDAIRNDCSEENLNTLLADDKEYQQVIHNWMVNKIGVDVATRLKKVCDDFGVQNITVNDLNVFKVPAISIEGIPNPTEGIMDAIVNIIAVIAGIITACVLPSVLALIVVLISIISMTLAELLLTALLAIPGAGWTLIIGIGGVVVFNALRRGVRGAKEAVLEKIKNFNLPLWSRRLVSENMLQNKLAAANIGEQIQTAIMEENAQQQIIDSVSVNIRDQIQQRIDMIKYTL